MEADEAATQNQKTYITSAIDYKGTPPQGASKSQARSTEMRSSARSWPSPRRACHKGEGKSKKENSEKQQQGGGNNGEKKTLLHACLYASIRGIQKHPCGREEFNSMSLNGLKYFPHPPNPHCGQGNGMDKRTASLKRKSDKGIATARLILVGFPRLGLSGLGWENGNSTMPKPMHLPRFR